MWYKEQEVGRMSKQSSTKKTMLPEPCFWEYRKVIRAHLNSDMTLKSDLANSAVVMLLLQTFLRQGYDVVVIIL